MTTINSESPPEDVAQFLSTITMPPGTTAEIVGIWTWIEFQTKPPEALRSTLKEAGFKWIKPRGKWAHTGGKPSRKGNGDPRYKYPVTEINVKEED